MTKPKTQASFYFGHTKARKSLETFREAYTLARSFGQPEAAAAVHYGIAALLKESRFPVKAYPCTYKDHYSGYPERARVIDIADLRDEKRSIAEWAIVNRATIEHTRGGIPELCRYVASGRGCKRPSGL